ncbi:urease accessory protein UreD [Corynebacterium sp. NPDC060344]|uniref:urease accessory protein UreD n=1 Tax=Corynebacterium sp. NPDC060344 TaxID=3347101 RepID=UPI003657E318
MGTVNHGGAGSSQSNKPGTGTNTAALPVGSPGKDGLLVLEFAPVERPGGARDAGPVTEWTRRRHRTPLHVTRPLHTDPALPGLPVVYAMCTGGGLVQGDRTRTEVTVRAGGHALVTSQAATKIHGMSDGFATNHIHLTAEPGSALEYLPDPTICFPGSSLRQSMVADVAPGATLIASDVTVMGRLSEVERVAPDEAQLATRITREGRPVLVDRVTLGGATADDALITGSAPVLGTLLVVVPEPAAARTLVAAMRAELDGGAGMDGAGAGAAELDGAELGAAGAGAGGGGMAYGVTTMHRDAGVIVRALGSDAEAVQRTFHRLWDIARRELFGVGAFDLRKR